jgi:hypothetical protein
MMIERMEFARPPENVRVAWCEWLRHHTIDPGDVTMHGFIERDTEARQVRYQTFNEGADGYYSFAVRVVQLESVPSPFPEACS